MNQIPDGERARLKQLHIAARAMVGDSARWRDRRYLLLAWAYMRGLTFRRVERRHTFQTNGGALADMYSAPVAGRRGVAPFEHNLPGSAALAKAVALLTGAPADEVALRAWLSEPCPDLAAMLLAEDARVAVAAE